MGRKRNSPPTACAVASVSAKAAISPGEAGWLDDMVLLEPARSALALSNGTYRSPRMMWEFQDNGLTVGRRRVARLMRENGLRARQKRRFKRTTDSHYAWPVAPNLLHQDFAATGPNKKWGTDISYV